MSALACALLRHDINARWVGDLRCTYCLTCECLWVPEPSDLPAQPRSAPPRLDQAAELTETELRYAWGDR